MDVSNQMREGSGSRHRSWLAAGFAISTVLALILAAHEVNRPPNAAILTSYAYWFVRLSAAFLLYAGATLVLEATPLRRYGGWPLCAVLGAIVSLIPFVMVVTMLDLAVGLPELEGAVKNGPSTGIFGRLVQEIGYLTDNHFFYCLLVTFPRILAGVRRDAIPAAAVLNSSAAGQSAPHEGSATAASETNPGPAFLPHVQPEVSGDIRVVEAQEHYIRVQTAEGSGLALYRFGDALRDLKPLAGMQVHRSYWVADGAVTDVRKARGGVRLVLDDGQEIPVSRRFEMTVASKFASSG